MEVKEAINIARDWVVNIYKSDHPQDIRLEEVEQTDGGNWLVTIGFSLPVPEGVAPSPFRPDLGTAPFYGRQFKSVKVNGTTGEVVAMRIRVP